MAQFCVSKLWIKLERKENLKIHTHTHTSVLAAASLWWRGSSGVSLQGGSSSSPCSAPVWEPTAKLSCFGCASDSFREERLPVGVHSPSSGIPALTLSRSQGGHSEALCSEHWRPTTCFSNL